MLVAAGYLRRGYQPEQVAAMSGLPLAEVRAIARRLAATQGNPGTPAAPG